MNTERVSRTQVEATRELFKDKGSETDRRFVEKIETIRVINLTIMAEKNHNLLNAASSFSPQAPLSTNNE